MAVKERVPHFRPPKRARVGESGRGTDGGTWLRSRRVEGRQALDADGCARDSAGVCRHSMRPLCVSRRRSKVVSRCRASSLAVWPGTILFFVRCVPPRRGDDHIVPPYRTPYNGRGASRTPPPTNCHACSVGATIGRPQTCNSANTRGRTLCAPTSSATIFHVPAISAGTYFFAK